MPDREIKYEDIKKALSPSDMAKYDSLCLEFVRLVGSKSNRQLWHELESPCRLGMVLNEIHQLNHKYGLIVEGQPFFSVWEVDVKTQKGLQKSWG